MFWYIVHVKSKGDKKLACYLNEQGNVKAFIPKVEKWYTINGIKDYIIKDLYPDYLFIKTSLDKDEFYEEYKDFFGSINGIAEMLDYDDVYAFNQEEQMIMEKLFNKENIIKHSIGNIVNSKLIVDSGPLVNLEDKVIKIDRHHRTATLKNEFFNGTFKVPLEVVTKS